MNIFSKKLHCISALLFTCFSTTLIAQNTQTDSISYYFESIQKTIKDNKYQTAMELSQKAIATYTNNDSLCGLANLSLGKILYAQRQYGASVQHLNTAITHFTKNGEYKLVHEAYSILGTLYRLKRDYNTARDYFSKAIAVIQKNYAEDHENLITVYKAMLLTEKSDQNFEKALEFTNKGLKLVEAYANEPQKAVFLTYKGDILQQQRNFDASIENYMKAIEIKERLYGTYHRGNLITYNNLAGAYSKLYYLDKAIEYQLRIIEINQKLPENQQIPYTSIYGNLATYYSEFGQPEKAIPYHKKALISLEKELGKDHFLYPMLHKNFGDTYYDLNDYKNAESYYKASLDYFLERSEVADINATEGYTNLALVAKKMGDFEKAETFLHAALKIYPKTHFLRIPCQIELANVLTKQQKFELANLYLDSIAQKLPKKTLSALHFDQLKDRKEYINAKINYYNSIPTSNADSLTHYYTKAIALDDFTIKEYTTATAKDFQLVKAFPLYESYLKHTMSSNDNSHIETVLEILEKTKARKLTEIFNKNKSAIKIKIPENLSKQEQQLNVDIVYYEEQKSLEINDPQPQSDSLLTAYNTKLFDLKRQKNQLQETFKNQYPNYYNLIYNREVIKVSEIQKNLKDNQCLLAYFVGENDIYICAVSKKAHQYISVPKDFPLQQWITQLREGIYNYWAMPNASDEDLVTYNASYKDIAHKLYKKLVAPLKNALTENIIIIPDGVLNFIPFEALLTEESSKVDDVKALPYVLKKHQISYNYSASLFGQLKEKEASQASNAVIAFAPTFGNENMETIAMRRNGLGTLKYNVQEVEAINNLFDANIFKDQQATKENFILNVNNHKIIHLSTHAKSNDIQGDYSFIAFTKQQDSLQKYRLFVRELYNLDLDADMVVLSACETGIGELQKGEGVISLARAFTYAGARSTVTSLWNVNDAQTTKLMTLFYTNLKEGMTKDEALHKAKLTYIENENLAAPYFWAAFIPAGDMEAIQFSNNYQTYYFIGAVLLALAGFLIYRRRKRHA